MDDDASGDLGSSGDDLLIDEEDGSDGSDDGEDASASGASEEEEDGDAPKGRHRGAAAAAAETKVAQAGGRPKKRSKADTPVFASAEDYEHLMRDAVGDGGGEGAAAAGRPSEDRAAAGGRRASSRVAQQGRGGRGGAGVDRGSGGGRGASGLSPAENPPDPGASAARSSPGSIAARPRAPIPMPTRPRNLRRVRK